MSAESLGILLTRRRQGCWTVDLNLNHDSEVGFEHGQTFDMNFHPLSSWGYVWIDVRQSFLSAMHCFQERKGAFVSRGEYDVCLATSRSTIDPVLPTAAPRVDETGALGEGDFMHSVTIISSSIDGGTICSQNDRKMFLTPNQGIFFFNLVAPAEYVHGQLKKRQTGVLLTQRAGFGILDCPRTPTD